MLLASSAKPLVTASSIKLDPSTLFLPRPSRILAASNDADTGRSPIRNNLVSFFTGLALLTRKIYGGAARCHNNLIIALLSTGSALFFLLRLSSRSFSHHGVAAVCACAFFWVLIVRPRSFDWLPTA
ncbi:hypothetical protein CI102_13606 [Trichoderma harzianum]|uniref:Uncharacterized protein n=1 Tax=Trichoderma harzianum CBS 226.95 TaxID=983964 RepID=A0A2T4A060_TRIHA|nr:hypothetical protein M431DRAFT_253338 [Trichoderma harzianum CBS 226.95]PKK41403.1 hypothetical protein CI102_13606 [Trichoderma harzianum]PTB50446.1 hypothetical protein M431DRAFT_253338 [Trichoderma harzianum CBS 226.95]